MKSVFAVYCNFQQEAGIECLFFKKEDAEKYAMNQNYRYKTECSWYVVEWEVY